MARTDTEVIRRPDGRIVHVTTPPWNQVRFGEGLVNAPEPMIYPRGAASNLRNVIGSVGYSDMAYAVNDQGNSRPLCPATGNQPLSIEHVGEERFQITVVEGRGRGVAPTHFKRFTLDGNVNILGEPETFTLASVHPSFAQQGTSQGHLDVQLGVLRWTDLEREIVRDGERLSLWMSRGAWTVAQLGRKNRVGLWNGVKLFISDVPTQLPPRLEVDADGLPHVAVSTDNGGRFLTLRDFREYESSLPCHVVAPEKNKSRSPAQREPQRKRPTAARSSHATSRSLLVVLVSSAPVDPGASRCRR